MKNVLMSQHRTHGALGKSSHARTAPLCADRGHRGAGPAVLPARVGQRPILRRPVLQVQHRPSFLCACRNSWGATPSCARARLHTTSPLPCILASGPGRLPRMSSRSAPAYCCGQMRATASLPQPSLARRAAGTCCHAALAFARLPAAYAGQASGLPLPALSHPAPALAEAFGHTRGLWSVDGRPHQSIILFATMV